MLMNFGLKLFFITPGILINFMQFWPIVKNQTFGVLCILQCWPRNFGEFFTCQKLMILAHSAIST